MLRVRGGRSFDLAQSTYLCLEDSLDGWVYLFGDVNERVDGRLQVGWYGYSMDRSRMPVRWRGGGLSVIAA